MYCAVSSGFSSVHALSDHLLNGVKSTIRTLGKDALANRGKSLQSRVIEAELKSRMAEQQIQQLKKEK